MEKSRKVTVGLKDSKHLARPGRKTSATFLALLAQALDNLLFLGSRTLPLFRASFANLFPFYIKLSTF